MIRPCRVWSCRSFLLPSRLRRTVDRVAASTSVVESAVVSVGRDVHHHPSSEEETPWDRSRIHPCHTSAHPFLPGRTVGTIGSAARSKGKVSFQRSPMKGHTDTPSGGPSVAADADPKRTTKATMTEVVLRVAMSCQGCAGSVRRVLGKVEGARDHTRGKDDERKEGEVRYVS